MKKMMTLIVLLSVLAITLPQPVLSQGFSVNITQPKGYGVTSGLGPKVQAESVVQIILVNIITIFFAVGGIGAVIYFIWGAVDWIVSGGDKEKVSSARKKMTNAIIGLVLLSLSYVIINIIGSVIGFNPLGDLQIRGLGNPGTPVQNQ